MEKQILLNFTIVHYYKQIMKILHTNMLSFKVSIGA